MQSCRLRFASETWPRPGLAEPQSASIAGFGNTGPLSSTKQKRKIVMTKTSRYKGLVLGSFLAPEIGMIFGELGPPLYGLALTTALRKTGTKLTRVFLFSVTCSMRWNYIRIYLFLEETGWIGSFQLMTCNLIVRILSDKSTHVYI